MVVNSNSVELTEVVLGKEGTEYIRWYLDEKGDTLAKLALNRNLDVGVVFSYLPSNFDRASVHRSREGGIMQDPDRVDRAKTRVAEFVSGFLNFCSNRIAVFETYFDAGRLAVIKPQLPFFSYQPTRYAEWDGKTSSSHEHGASLYVTSEQSARFNIEYLPPQQNLWGDSGSGSRPKL